MSSASSMMNFRLGGILINSVTTAYDKAEHHSQGGLPWTEIGAHDLAFGVFVSYKDRFQLDTTCQGLGETYQDQLPKYPCLSRRLTRC